MYGEPNDVDGQCNAHLFIGDNMGDNHATMRCQLSPGHEGLHEESFSKNDDNPVVVTWAKNEAEE